MRKTNLKAIYLNLLLIDLKVIYYSIESQKHKKYLYFLGKMQTFIFEILVVVSNILQIQENKIRFTIKNISIIFEY